MSEMSSCPYCNGSFSTAGFIHTYDCPTLKVDGGTRTIDTYYCLGGFDALIAERDEARRWARKLYRENIELRRQLDLDDKKKRCDIDPDLGW